jgi:hypothetical protein
MFNESTETSPAVVPSTFKFGTHIYSNVGVCSSSSSGTLDHKQHPACMRPKKKFINWCLGKQGGQVTGPPLPAHLFP